MIQRIDPSQRRARLAVRHRLAPPARVGDAVRVADDLVGIHATDPVSVYLEVLARTEGVTMDRLSAALYDDRSLLRILGMRRTMFVVPVELAGLIQTATARDLADAERRRLLGFLASAGITREPAEWLADVERQTVAALAARGEATAAELARDVPGLREQIPFGQGKKWQGTMGVSTRVLFLLATEGRVIRGRPQGSVVSSLYRWSPIDRWVEGGLPDIPPEQARCELARRYLRAFGPVTVADVRWWSGWSAAKATVAIAAAGAVEVDLGNGTGLVLADDLAPAETPEPWVALLPALDSTVMGWSGRDWYLGPHRDRLFDRNGNAGPSVWCDGRVVGGWAQRADGEIAVRLLEDLGRDAEEAVEREAQRVRAWLGSVRWVPRFRTPLERELSA
ncbi:MAG: winged helix DNA-binding domain-containing protein [Chloroflexota bacterium]